MSNSNQNEPRTKFSTVGEVLEDQIANIAINLIKQKPKAEREPSRVNLTVVGIAAFVMLVLLDLIASILVGSITHALYGIVTFAVGVGSLSIAWVGHFYPYAGVWQKRISVIDMILSIGSTLVIGVLAAIVNASNFFGIFNEGVRGVVEIVLLVSLVGVGILHSIAFVAYVFTDDVIKRNQRNLSNKALHNENLATIQMAKERTGAVISLATELKEMIASGQGGILREQIKNLSGEDLLGEIVVSTNETPRQNAYAPAKPSDNGSRPAPVPMDPSGRGQGNRV